MKYPNTALGFPNGSLVDGRIVVRKIRVRSRLVRVVVLEDLELC